MSETPRTDAPTCDTEFIASWNDWEGAVCCKLEDYERLERELAAERKLSEAISRDCNNTANERNELQAQLMAERKRADEAEAKLYKIARTPVMPFPDPGAHSERAFSDAVYRAWSDIQRIARNREAMKNG